MNKILLLLAFHLIFYHCVSQPIIPGANRTHVYVPLIKHKRIALFANHTSIIGDKHLVDSLKSMGVNIVKIFAPEHGFRGTANAGESINTYQDPQTGIKIISLYGNRLKPSEQDLSDIDVLIFDIQDVGVRFYTYISSLQYFMEAALENGKPLMILDRPNPNGFYVDGPILQQPFKSFVGMQPVPIVYGMTLGEYAMMIAGEGWLNSEAANKKYAYYKTAENSADTLFHFIVIKCINYTHDSKYILPVQPSPNLPDMSAIYWYPSTCLFEGTILSEGRGTNHPFEIFGHPDLPKTLYSFTPQSNEGAAFPKLKGSICYGWNVHNDDSNETLNKINNRLQLNYLVESYKLFPQKDIFFIQPKSGKEQDYFFNKLAGNGNLKQQIIAGKSAKEICRSWQPDILAFKEIRKKYLLYPDFE